MIYNPNKCHIFLEVLKQVLQIWLFFKDKFNKAIIVFSVLNEDWTSRDLYGFQAGLSLQEQIFR